MLSWTQNQDTKESGLDWTGATLVKTLYIVEAPGSATVDSGWYWADLPSSVSPVAIAAAWQPGGPKDWAAGKSGSAETGAQDCSMLQNGVLNDKRCDIGLFPICTFIGKEREEELGH